MTSDIESSITSTAGRALYRLLPELYRVRDGGDLAKYLDASGVLLDQLRNTIRQLLADQAPSADNTESTDRASQDWTLPYLADLFDVKVVSPHSAGRRLEIQNAVRWRQRSGTLRVVDEIAEAFVTQEMQTGEEDSPDGIEVQEGISRLAVTPRIDLMGRVSDPDAPETISPDHFAVPWVTPDTRVQSRALRVAAGTAGARSAAHGGEDVYWMSTHPAGAPCFPGTYQDRSRRTPDMRTASWRHGSAHARRVALYLPPRSGFFPEGWQDGDNVDHDRTVDATGGESELAGRIVTGTLSVTAGALALEKSAVNHVVVAEGASVTAKDCLLGTVQASDGFELHDSTVLGNLSARRVQATGSIFGGEISLLYPPDEIAVLSGHTSWVNTVAISPDSSRAVTAASDRTLRIWDLGNGSARHTLTGHFGAVRAVAITPDGNRVISGSVDRRVRVWDMETGAAVRTLTGHTAPVNRVKVTPDGSRVISASRDRSLKVWNIASGTLIHTLAGHSNWVLDVATTPDGRLAVSASLDRTLRVWDLGTGAVIRTLSGHTNSVDAVAITPDGKYVISASRDRTLRVWDLDTGAFMRTLTGHSGQVRSLAVTPDGQQVVSGSFDRTARVWNIETGAQVHRLAGHTGVVIAVALAPDGTRAFTASYDKTVREWDLASGSEIHAYAGHTGRLFDVAVAPSGEVAVSTSIDSDRTARVWDLKRELLQSCIRYSRVPESVTSIPGDAMQLLPPGSCTTDKPFFASMLFCPPGGAPELRGAGFGEAGAGVLHPSTPDSIWQGGEDGGEMGCYHHRYYALSWSAAETKLAGHLPLGITPVLIPDPTLARVPPEPAG